MVIQINKKNLEVV